METVESYTAVSTGAPVETAAAPTEQVTAPVSKPEATLVEDKAEPLVDGSSWDSVKGEFEGKPAVSMAIDFVANTGLTMEDPAVMAVIEDGDYTMIRAKLAAMGVQGYEPMLAILEGESNAYLAEQEQRQQTDVANVQNILGENHEEIWSWAKESMDETDKSVFNSLFEAGGQSAMVAAIALGAIYDKQFQGTKAAKSVTADIAASTPAANGGLSRQEFLEETQKLAKVYGNPIGTPEYAKLQARRALSRSRGM